MKKIDSANMGKSDISWLDTKFHFSFANYYNKDNMRFGVLRVLNDDIISPHKGFEMHSHRDMEIVTYIVDGNLTHEDSEGNKRTLNRGEVQFMSAGTGIYHSEFNLSDNPLHTLQIWIIPDKLAVEPNYGDYKFKWDDRVNKWLHIVSSKEGDAPIKINQDVNMFVLSLDKGKSIKFDLNENRMAYLVQIEGNSIINQIDVNEKDALESLGESFDITAKSNSHFILIEMNNN